MSEPNYERLFADRAAYCNALGRDLAAAQARVERLEGALRNASLWAERMLNGTTETVGYADPSGHPHYGVVFKVADWELRQHLGDCQAALSATGPSESMRGRMAAAEEACGSQSVGGLAVDLGLHQQPRGDEDYRCPGCGARGDLDIFTLVNDSEWECNACHRVGQIEAVDAGALSKRVAELEAQLAATKLTWKAVYPMRSGRYLVRRSFNRAMAWLETWSDGEYSGDAASSGSAEFAGPLPEPEEPTNNNTPA